MRKATSTGHAGGRTPSRPGRVRHAWPRIRLGPRFRLPRGLPLGALLLAIALDALAFGFVGDYGGLFGGGWRFAPLLPTPRQHDFAAAFSAQDLLNQDLIDRAGVAGTAVALGPDGRLVLKVMLTHAGAVALPARFDGHAVMGEVTGPFRAYAASVAGAHPAGPGVSPRAAANTDDPRRSFPRPVPIGVSTGQVDVTAGTIGARVATADGVFALSNNHVFANRNQADVGDPILQPGRVDGGANPADAIGVLHDFEPIRFCQPFPVCPANRIDAAIASTTAGDLGNATPGNGYGTPRSDPMEARLGLAVQKYGRTTGHTRSRITGINATINVGFGDGTARFSGQIVVGGGNFSGPGDSGSLIVSDGVGGSDRRPVGLLFAGSPTTTLANPIGLVLDRFGVRIDGSD